MKFPAWNLFPQSKFEAILSKRRQPFLGQYLLSDNLPAGFDRRGFFHQNGAVRWLYGSGTDKQTKQPFCMRISSAWVSRCHRHFLWPMIKSLEKLSDVLAIDEPWLPNSTSFMEFGTYSPRLSYVNFFLYPGKNYSIQIKNPHFSTLLEEKQIKREI